MFSLKVFLIKALLWSYFCSYIVAQSKIETEIICTGLCNIDSTLFFREPEPKALFDSAAYHNHELFGAYFDHFPDIKADILVALSYYPELQGVKIKFSYRSIKQTMNSRPSPLNMFRKKVNWRYSIIVNNNKGRHKALPFEKLPFSMKVGWLGHELAHTLQYQQMSSGEMMIFAYKYVFSKRFVRKAERYTDLLTIEHDLAYPLYIGTDYLLNRPDIDKKYRQYALLNSLSLNEIKCLWCKYSTETFLISRKLNTIIKH
jgi:hypothetical protein